MTKTALSKQLAKVLYRIQVAAQNAGRDAKEIQLIAVSKSYPAQVIEEVYRAGCKNFGENRIPDALEKQATLPKAIRWHFIGTLQSNKVSKAIGHFALIHSVDSLNLAKVVSKYSKDRNLCQDVLLQVNTSGEPTKHGMTPEYCKEQFSEFLELPNIRIKGLMTMAPHFHAKSFEEQNRVRLCFRALKELQQELIEESPKKLPQFNELSMGMSQDFEIAIQEGATMLRIGSAIFTFS